MPVRPEYAQQLERFWQMHGGLFADQSVNGTNVNTNAPVVDLNQQPDFYSSQGYTPEGYAAAAGELRAPAPRPQDAMQPAAQGVADVAAMAVAPVLQSGHEFYEDPGIATGTNLAANTLMAAAPVMGAARTAQAMTGVVGTGGAAAITADAMGTHSPAEAIDRKKRPAQAPRPKPDTIIPLVEPKGPFDHDPEVQSIDQQLAGIRAKSIDPAVPKSSRMELMGQIRDLQTRRADVISRLSAGRRPFAEAYPTANAMWPAIQMGAGAATGFGVRVLDDTVHALDKLGARSSLKKAENAFANGDVATAVEKNRRVQNWVDRQPKTGFSREAMPVAAGAVVGAEVTAFPYQYDKRNAPEGSEAKEKADRALSVDNAFSTLGTCAALGALGGMTGAHLSPTFRGGGVKDRAAALKRTLSGEEQAVDEYAEALKAFNARSQASSSGMTPGNASPVVPSLAGPKVSGAMMQHPNRPKAAVTFDHRTGTYRDAKGQFVPF